MCDCKCVCVAHVSVSVNVSVSECVCACLFESSREGKKVNFNAKLVRNKSSSANQSK